MSIDAFIERLQALKTVEGITGDTDVVMPCYTNRGPSSSLYQKTRLRAVHIAGKDNIEDQDFFVVKKGENHHGLVVSVF